MGNTTALCSGARIEELQGQIDEQEKTIAELRRQSTMLVGEKDAEVELLKKQLQGLHEEVERTRAEGQAKTEQEIEEREGRIAALDGRIEQLEERLEEAQRERMANEARKVEIAERDAKIERMGREAEELKESMESLRADAEQRTEAEVAAREARIHELSGQLASTTEEVGRLQAEQEEAQRLRREYEEHKARVAELEPRVNTLSTLLDAREAELSRVKADSDRRREEMDRLSSQIGELQSTAADAEEAKTALTLTRGQIEELQIELEAKRHIEAEVNRMQREMADQKKALQHERRRSVQLEAKMHLELLSKYRSFGVPAERCVSEEVPGLESPIPSVLVRLRKGLIDGGGLESVGIFRLAPNQTEIDRVKELLDRNAYEGDSDVNTMANLIGAWFREQPRAVLADTDTAKVLKAKKPKAAWKVITTQVPEPQRSIFTWLCDLGALVASKSDVNRMTPKNLAIVFVPNVFEMPELSTGTNSKEAMLVMEQIKQSSVFIEHCIQHRMAENPPQEA